MTAAARPVGGIQLLSIREVTAKLGIHPASIYRWMKAGDFPQSIALTKKVCRWREDEIDAWLADRAKDR